MAELNDYQRLVNRIKRAADELKELDGDVEIDIKIQVPPVHITGDVGKETKKP